MSNTDYITIIVCLVAGVITTIGWLIGSRNKITSESCSGKMKHVYNRLEEKMSTIEHDKHCDDKLEPMRKDIAEIKVDARLLRQEMSDGFKQVLEAQRQSSIANVTKADLFAMIQEARKS